MTMIRSLIMAVFFSIGSLTVVSQDTVVLQPGPDEGKDAQLWSIHPDDNYGNNRKFVAIGWTFQGVPGVHRAIIDFDLSEIPPGSTIDEAWLYLYFYSDEPSYVPHSGVNQAYLKLITTHWEEELVSWNTQPFTTTAHMVNVPRSKYPEQDYEINVTELITERFENPGSYFGMMLQLENEIPYTSLMFASSDNADPALRPKLLIIYTPCQVPEAGFSFEVIDGRVEFQDLSSNAESWSWDFGDGSTSDLQNPVHTYDEEGHYLVCLTAGNSCSQDTFCDSVHYCQVPQAGFSCHTEGMTVFFQDESENASSCHWDFGNGFYSVLECPEYTFEQEGLYDICLTVKNECGCSTLCDTVRVKHSIPESPDLHLGIYPNPATSHVFIRFPYSGNYDVVLVHSLGKTVWQEELRVDSGEVREYDVSSLASGMYIMKVEKPDIISFTKLIIQH